MRVRCLPLACVQGLPMGSLTYLNLHNCALRKIENLTLMKQLQVRAGAAASGFEPSPASRRAHRRPAAAREQRSCGDAGTRSTHVLLVSCLPARTRRRWS